VDTVRANKTGIWVLILAAGWMGTLFAQNPGDRAEVITATYTVYETLEPVRVDGVLDEEIWRQAEKIAIDTEWLPGDNIPAPVSGYAMVGFDENRLYVAFFCEDPQPAKIRAHLMDRDAIDTFIQDDHVDFMIDTFNDERRAFQFRINPLGIQADAIFSEMEGYEDFSWDAIWESAGKIGESGYTIEVAIPFNQIRFAKTSGAQTWGFSAGRSYPRKVRHRMLSHPRSRSRNCILCQFNKITGFGGIKPGKNIELDPTLTSTRTDNLGSFPGGEMENGKLQVEPGITAKWGVSSNLILNATANPDFSQVEADVAQLEVNTRFALRYPEKRPFFLEGADMFLTPMEAVFTRTVYDPRFGLKFSGKSGKNAFGVFGTLDRFNNLLIPSNQGSMSSSLEEDVFGGVVRYRRDVGRGSAVGFLYTGRSNDSYHNHVTGVDGFFRLSRTKTLQAQALYSDTRYPLEIQEAYDQPTGSFGSHAFYLNFTHAGRDYQYSVTYRDFGAGFRSDFGFIPRVDYRSLDGFFQRTFWGKEGAWFDRLSFSVQGAHTTDQAGEITDQSLECFGYYSGSLQTVLQGGYLFNRERYQGKMYNLHSGVAYLEMKPVGGVYYYLTGLYGDTIDYTNQRAAKSLFVQPGIEVGLGKHINFNLSHNYERLSAAGSEIYKVNLLQTRLIYNFNRRSFLRAIVQYLAVSRNPGMYVIPVDPATRTLFTQFLYSYKINPQTVLFLGYSDNYLGLQGIDVTRTDRTFFLKISYAFIM